MGFGANGFGKFGSAVGDDDDKKAKKKNKALTGKGIAVNGVGGQNLGSAKD